MKIYQSPIGLAVYKYEDTTGFTITGNVSIEHTIKEFDGAGDFEDHIRKNVACKSITFDSEYCQFWAYAKSKAAAISFVKRVEKHFINLQKIFA